LVWDQEVESSNLSAPIWFWPKKTGFFGSSRGRGRSGGIARRYLGATARPISPAENSTPRLGGIGGPKSRRSL